MKWFKRSEPVSRGSWAAMEAEVESRLQLSYSQARAAYMADPANAENIARAEREAASGSKSWVHRNVVAFGIEALIPWPTTARVGPAAEGQG
jgi:hypothetical protein